MAFWRKPPTDDDLESHLTYFKDSDLDTLAEELLRDRPASEKSVSKPTGPSQQLLANQGRTLQDFAGNALLEPELWTDEELRRLEVAYASNIAPEGLVELIERYESGQGPTPPTSPIIRSDQRKPARQIARPSVTTKGDPIDVSHVKKWWLK